MNSILKQAREVYKNREEEYYLETIRKTADELEATKKELQELKQDVCVLLDRLDLHEESDSYDSFDGGGSFVYLVSGSEENCYINDEKCIEIINKLSKVGESNE